MSIHRYQSTWRSIIFNRVYDNSGNVDDPAALVTAYKESDYRLESVDPTAVTTQDFRELRQHLEGAEPAEAYEGVRLITGQGRILASSVTDLEDKTWAMYEAFSPAACRAVARIQTPPGVLPYQFRRASASGTKQLRFYCRPSVGRPVVIGRMREGLSRPFQFQLVALDPFAYEESETQLQLAAGSNNILNAGNIYTPRVQWRIQLDNSGTYASNFTINNTTTGESIVLNLSSFVSQYLVIIDVARGLIFDSMNNSRYSTRVSGYASAMRLDPGYNTVSLSNLTGVESVYVYYRGAFA